MGIGRIVENHQAFGATLGGCVAAGAASMHRPPWLGPGLLIGSALLCLAKLWRARAAAKKDR